MFRLLKTLICIIIFSSFSAAQPQGEKPVAKIGSTIISVDEFRERFELTPQVNRHIKGREDLYKEELLYSIIAEKLWSLEAENLRLDTTEIMRSTFTTLEKMYWRDALYDQEIKQKTNIKTEDYVDGRKRSAYILNTKFIYFERSGEIDSIYQILMKGFPFDTLLAYRSEYLIQDTLFTVTYGNMEKYAEDAVYGLKIGEFTTPIKSPEGWYIFKLESVAQNIIENEKQAKALEQNVKKVVEARAVDEVFLNYYQNFFRDVEVSADGELFWSFANAVITTLNLRKIKGDIPDGETVGLETEDYYAIEKEISADTLSMVFIKFAENPVTLRQFLHAFVFEGFYTNNLNPDIIRAKLNSRVRTFIEQELHSREAYRKGMQNNPEVKRFTGMWRDNYMSTLYKRELFRDVKISDEEAFRYYQKNNEGISYPKQVNIIELLTDSLDVVEKALNELENGADLKELARIHTKRKWTKENGGEFGFFPTTAYGELGRIAGELEIGEIFGPLELDDGYSIFKVIDKKDEAESIPKPFEELKDEIKRKLKAEKLSQKMIDKTVELANKYGVQVDELLLKQIKVTNLTMLVYKYMGFGGRILAVPLTNQFIEWVDDWKEGSKSLP